jgi:hypothetical protein
MPASQPMLLIIDYNLSRIDDVRHMRDHALRSHGAGVVLVRHRPSPADRQMCDDVIDLDPLDPGFVAAGLRLLGPRRDHLRAGIVFSDDAVRSGAQLLQALGLPVDSPDPAAGAFCKHRYRLSEARHASLLAAQRILIPDFREVTSVDDVVEFARQHPDGFILKPSQEGNNRGVVLVRPGDDAAAAFAEVMPYLDGGAICEQVIPYRREYSFDGLGSASFITEKMNAGGRYPVEVAQVLPAELSDLARTTVERVGRQVNWLVGQCDGPFHNEIKISDDGAHAAVVEPNRRPAGMKIWSLARWVYGIDLYHRWIDAAFDPTAVTTLPEPRCAAATVMLGVTTDRSFLPADIAPGADPFGDAVAATAERHDLRPDELVNREFGWLSRDRRDLHRIPRDNADFSAYGCITLHTDRVDIRDVVHTVRERWLDALDRAGSHVTQAA